MKKLLLAILLTVINTSALAGWKLDYVHKDFDTYFETTSIRKNGSKATMWVLTDYKTLLKGLDTDKAYLSKMTKYEYHCKKETSTVLYRSLYEGSMGNGNVVGNFDSANGKEKENSLPPNSIGEGLMKVACGKN